VWFVPRRYDDVRNARPIGELMDVPEGERVTLVAHVVSSRMVFVRGRRWGEARLIAPEGTPPASMTVRWFNVYAGIDKRVPAGSTVVLSGPLKRREGRLELTNPDILGALGSANAPQIIARYPEIAGIPAGRLRSACAIACERVAECLEDGVPAVVEQAAGMPSLAETVSTLHAPPPTITADDLSALNRGDSKWQKRLAFGELFALGVAVALRRRDRRADNAVACAKLAELDAQLATILPFTLTNAQRRSIHEMAADLATSSPMNRLLQGDVGAGKTAVAFAAALQVARAGRQTGLMAPTELLAEQHATTWRAWAQKAKLRVELLTASTPKPVRASILALLAAGELDVLIGTHSLLAESVGFGRLGLVVIDEQHRFGVAQRAKLRDKGDGQGAPHLLVMTATPIPRTLALTAYGNLDTSILDELPPGRLPVATKLLTGVRGCKAAYKLIEQRVALGERAYVVCPKVEPTDEDDLLEDQPKRQLKDATTTADELRAALPKARIGLVHGRMRAEDRDAAMRAFKEGALDVLCATTVIEVGVDVPAATVMVIHDAERFGLAQLHQLRGRVGRGGGAAHCILLSQGTLSEEPEARLNALVGTNDGFVIAEADLAHRGAGDLLGARQAGLPKLRFGSLADHTALLLEARGHAERVLVEDPALVEPHHAPLRRALERRLKSAVFGPETG
jgi:ATP-dependent DNA helicase RecG